MFNFVLGIFFGFIGGTSALGILSFDIGAPLLAFGGACWILAITDGSGESERSEPRSWG